MADEKKQMPEEQLDKVSGGMRIVLEGPEAEEYIRQKNMAMTGYSGSSGYSGGWY